MDDIAFVFNEQRLSNLLVFEALSHSFKLAHFTFH